MLSLVEVQCPHCEVRGQIMVPPLGGIVFGPCPQCNEPVVIFCGKALPLDGATMREGDVEERREHMLAVLSEFLNDRLAEMLSQPTSQAEEEAPQTGDGDLDVDEPEDAAASAGRAVATPSNPITEEELKRFAEVDLEQLDDPEYFRSVFHNN